MSKGSRGGVLINTVCRLENETTLVPVATGLVGWGGSFISGSPTQLEKLSVVGLGCQCCHVRGRLGAACLADVKAVCCGRVASLYW